MQAKRFMRWTVLFLLFTQSVTVWAATSGTANIGLVVAMQDQTTLNSAKDYASYGALQLFAHLGLAKTDIPPEALASEEELARFKVVVNPATSLAKEYALSVLSYVEQGGVYISGGLDMDLPAAGVTVLAKTSAGKPALFGNFTHNAAHPILTSVHSSGLPVLLPPGCQPFGIIKATNGANGYGKVTFKKTSGDALIIAQYGKGWFITFGVNPFATVGYGMGMATEPAEPHYIFPTKPGETDKSFNWQTALAIKETYINDDKTNLIWGDEYTKLVLQTLLWAYDQIDTPLAWQWYWPNAYDMAATIQHDWDSGDGYYARQIREAETGWGVKSVLYVLIPSMKSAQEVANWYKSGWEVGLHADKEPLESQFLAKMRKDMQTIAKTAGVPISIMEGVAHHYVRYYKDAPLWWEQLRLTYDSSWYDMDWKQVFFTGTSHPFFIKVGGRILPVLELPSRNEEGVQTNNNGAYYLGQLNIDLAKARVRDYVDAVERMNGHASFNVHPNSPDINAKPFVQEQGYVAYIKGFDGYSGKNAWWATPLEVANWYKGRSQVGITQHWNGNVLQVELSITNITTSLPLTGYTLLAPAQQGSRAVRSVLLDEKPIAYRIVQREGRDFAEVIFDLAVNCTLRFVYSD